MTELSQGGKMETTQVQSGGEVEYRAVTVPAVLALVLGLLSVLALATPILWALPVAAGVVAVVAIRRIRSAPSEWTGIGMAYAGLALAVVFLVGGMTSRFTTRALVKLHAKAIGDRFVKRLEQGDIEGAFWLAVPKSQRRLALEKKLDKEQEDGLFHLYADFYRRVHPKLEIYGPDAKFTFDKFVGIYKEYGNYVAELIYLVPSEGQTRHIYVRAVGAGSPEYFWKRDWRIGFFELE